MSEPTFPAHPVKHAIALSVLGVVLLVGGGAPVLAATTVPDEAGVSRGEMPDKAMAARDIALSQASSKDDVPMVMIGLAMLVAIAISAMLLYRRRAARNGQASGLPSGMARPSRKVGIAAAVLTALAVTAVGITAVSNSRAAGPFLSTQGKDLMYNGQKVVLKGANFDNIGAIGTWQGAGTTNQIGTNEEDYRQLSAYGGNHVRFGMTTKWFIDNKANAFQVMDQQVAWAKAHNIWLTPVFFHPYPGNCTENYGQTCAMWTNPTSRAEMKKLWVEIAARYRDEPAIAGYDLLNEPTPPNNDCNGWWPLAQEWRDAMYAVDPNHLVFVESCASSVFWVKLNGTNVVYSSHDYAPQAYSHSEVDASKVYPGYATDWDGKSRYYDKNALLTSTDPVMNLRKRIGLEWADNNDVPFYIGEWGARSTYPTAAKYVQDRSEIYNLWGVNHAFYTWQHDCNTCQWRFGLFNYGVHPLDLEFPDKLAAFRISLAGAVKPSFNGTTSPTATPAATPVPTAGVPVGEGSHNDSTFTYTGPWYRSTATGLYNGDDQYSDTAGHSFALRFNGTQARLYASKAPNHGKGAVSVDGGPETVVDLYAAARADQSLVYATPALASGTHTLTVRVLGQRHTAATDAWFNADRIDVSAVPQVASPTPTPAKLSVPIRINAGGPAYVSPSGTSWIADRYSDGGSVSEQGTGMGISGTEDDALYQTERYGAFGYDLPVANGTYRVRIHLAEIYSGCQAAGCRKFGISAEGTTVADEHDVFATAGGFAAQVIERTVTVTDGQLDVDLTTGSANLPKLSALEVLAATVAGDLNGDGKVGVMDLSALLSQWGKTAVPADINKDGTVDIRDLSVLLSAWTG